MSWQPYSISLVAGLVIAVTDGLIAIRNPAPPKIALLGLVGVLAGEAAVQWLRGHSFGVAGMLS